MRKSLEHVRVFRKLAPERRAAIEKQCSWRQVSAGAMIVAHEDQTRSVYFLADGHARSMIYAASGTIVGFGDLVAGSMFGEVAAIDGQPRTVGVEAVTACTVATLPADQFLDLVRHEPDFALTVLEQIARNIRALTARVFEFSTLPVANRLHAELLRLADIPAKSEIKTAPLRTTPTHAELAARISTHREAVTRELNRLVKLGVVKKGDTGLIIADVGQLRALISAATSR